MNFRYPPSLPPSGVIVLAAWTNGDEFHVLQSAWDDDKKEWNDNEGFGVNSGLAVYAWAEWPELPPRQPAPKKLIEKIATDAAALTRETRYGHAKEKALAVAVRIQSQVDFVETLDICMRASLSIADLDLCITTSRAVEMYERLEHYLDCLGKYYARNREIAAQAELFNPNSKGETNDLL